MKEIILMPPELRTALVDDIINSFTPEKISVYIAAQWYNADELDNETMDGVKYKKMKIPKERINDWKSAKYNVDSVDTELKLPPKKKLPTKFHIKANQFNVKQEFPETVRNTPFVRVWHKQDNEFRVPKATMIFHFVSPFAYTNPLNSVLTDMFAGLLQKSLNEYIAELTGLKLEITSTIYGIKIRIDGYDEMQYVLLNKTLELMINIDPESFKIPKSYKNKYRIFSDDMYSNTNHYLEMLLSERHWSNDKLQKSMTRCHVLFEKVSENFELPSTIVYYATGLRSPKSNVLLLLLKQIIGHQIFKIFRIDESLAYTSFSDICTTINGTQYFTVAVQNAENHNPNNVEERIDKCMKTMLDHISNMPREEFKKLKEGLRALFTPTSPNTISSQGSLYWTEIESQEYYFNRVDIELQNLDAITQQDLRDFFEATIAISILYLD
ncbi:insulin-degrading enzyme-like [Temnothorax americanus]|uniref:insulin-degrading enzyme-like n=1 Tax=Temnothorax americanus TaxID=1964332 RepID=UPI0040686B36